LNSKVILGEIEKGRDIGKTAALCVGLAAFSDLIKKIQYVVFRVPGAI
jgi:hypothetical protein